MIGNADLADVVQGRKQEDLLDELVAELEFLRDRRGDQSRVSRHALNVRAGFEIAQIGKGNQSYFELRAESDGSPYALGLSPIACEKDCITCHSESKPGDPLGYVGLLGL